MYIIIGLIVTSITRCVINSYSVLISILLYFSYYLYIICKLNIVGTCLKVNINIINIIVQSAITHSSLNSLLQRDFVEFMEK